MSLQTTACVYCGGPATIWTGHVLRKGEKIMAGWCSETCAKEPGFVGHYKKWMGKEPCEN